MFRSLCTTSAQGVASRWTHYQQSLYARALPKSAAAGHRGAPICSQAARWWLAHHMVGRGRGRGPRTRAWPRTCGAAARRLNFRRRAVAEQQLDGVAERRPLGPTLQPLLGHCAAAPLVRDTPSSAGRGRAAEIVADPSKVAWIGPAPPACASHPLTHSFSHIRVRLSSR